VNETATKNVWQHHFPEPCGGGGGAVGQISPQRQWKWQHFVNLMKIIDSSLPSVTHIWLTLSDFFLHLTRKRIQRMTFKKNA
jgi:hypothetical protein